MWRKEAAQEAFTAAIDHWRMPASPSFSPFVDHRDRQEQGDRPDPPAGPFREQACIEAPPPDGST